MRPHYTKALYYFVSHIGGAVNEKILDGTWEARSSRPIPEQEEVLMKEGWKCPKNWQRIYVNWEGNLMSCVYIWQVMYWEAFSGIKQHS